MVVSYSSKTGREEQLNSEEDREEGIRRRNKRTKKMHILEESTLISLYSETFFIVII